MLLLVVVASAICALCSAGPVVQTSAGPIEGSAIGDLNRFLGHLYALGRIPLCFLFGMCVPYAQPPIGMLRWQTLRTSSQRPRPIKPWSGVKQALNFANSCMQAGFFSFPQSEDCLYLNIWAPQNVSNASVMFWIHGGGWEFGTPIYFDGTNLSAIFGVIIVTAAYRLGPLGFLAETTLLEHEPYLGSLGTLDQQLAMEWVQKNIAAFGGNPDRVTIFGQSAGGGSVGIHLTLPSSKGLYRNAISESGLFFFPAIEESLPQGEALVDALNCTNAKSVYACLLNAPAGTVMHALTANGDITVGFRNNSFGVHWFPIIDGEYFPGQPIVLARKGAVNANAVIIGTNAQEGSVFVYPQFNFTQLKKAQFEFWVNASWGPSFVAPSFENYHGDIKHGDYLAALSGMTGDFWFQCQRQLFSQATAAANITTYTYLFSYPYTRPGQPNLGATHGDEVAFVWDGGEPFNSFEVQLALWVSSAWTSFAKTDNPNDASWLQVIWSPRNTSSEVPINFNTYAFENTWIYSS